MTVTRIPVSLYAPHVAEIDKRSDNNRSGAVQAIVTQYAEIMQAAKRDLQARFEPNEKALIVDALNGVYIGDAANVRLLSLAVIDAIELDGLGAKWEVQDPDDLKRRLRALEPVEKYAIADAVSIFWIAVSNASANEQPQPADLFTL